MEGLGGPMAARPLHFIWILDCSGSMRFEGRIQALNTAIAEAVPLMHNVAHANPHADLLVRAVTFSTEARWHIEEPVSVTDFTWTDVTAGGDSNMGAALTLVAHALQIPPMTRRALPPVLVLISDGQPTDNYGAGLEALLATPWGPNAIRIAIAIGRDSALDVLQDFMGRDNNRRPLHAGSPDDLVAMIRWASTVVVRQSSQPMVDDGPPPDPLHAPPTPDDIWVWQ